MIEETTQVQASPPKRSNLFVRVVSSVIALPLLLALIIFGGSELWALFIAVAAFLGLWEWFKMLMPQESNATRAISSVIALLPAVGAYVLVGEHKVYYLNMGSDVLIMAVLLSLCMWAAFLFHSLRNRDIPRAAQAITSTLGGAMYVSLGFLFLALIKRDFFDEGNAWLFTLMAMTWLSDTGAYFTGRALGKHKLAPVLSPKKTVEGAAGGLLAAIIAAICAKYIAFPELSAFSVVILAVIANFLAQTGDLAESLIKRSCQVKDSGSLIPGHGGILDRVDALIFSAPWVYFFASMSIYAY